MNFEKLVCEVLEEKKKSKKKRKSKVPSNKIWGYWGPWYGANYSGIGSGEGGGGEG